MEQGASSCLLHPPAAVAGRDGERDGAGCFRCLPIPGSPSASWLLSLAPQERIGALRSSPDSTHTAFPLPKTQLTLRVGDGGLLARCPTPTVPDAASQLPSSSRLGLVPPPPGQAQARTSQAMRNCVATTASTCGRRSHVIERKRGSVGGQGGGQRHGALGPGLRQTLTLAAAMTGCAATVNRCSAAAGLHQQPSRGRPQPRTHPPTPTW